MILIFIGLPLNRVDIVFTLSGVSDVDVSVGCGVSLSCGLVWLMRFGMASVFGESQVLLDGEHRDVIRGFVLGVVLVLVGLWCRIDLPNG